MATFPFLIVRNTFSIHILSNILIFIRHKSGFSKSSPLSGQYEKYSTSYEPIELKDFRIQTAYWRSYIIASNIA